MRASIALIFAATIAFAAPAAAQDKNVTATETAVNATAPLPEADANTAAVPPADANAVTATEVAPADVAATDTAPAPRKRSRTFPWGLLGIVGLLGLLGRRRGG